MILEVSTSIAALFSIPPVHVEPAGDTALSLACANGHLDTVKYLVNERHWDPRSETLNCCIIQYTRTCTDTVNKAGDTPLSLAYKGGHWDLVKYLTITHHCDTKSKSHLSLVC